MSTPILSFAQASCRTRLLERSEQQPTIRSCSGFKALLRMVLRACNILTVWLK
jgi:hypothetical protein